MLICWDEVSEGGKVVLRTAQTVSSAITHLIPLNETESATIWAVRQGGYHKFRRVCTDECPKSLHTGFIHFMPRTHCCYLLLSAASVLMLCGSI